MNYSKVPPIKPEPTQLAIYCSGCYAKLSDDEKHKFLCPLWFPQTIRALLGYLGLK